MKILLLCTDAYGGHGGIALFNRELLSALAAMPDCEEVVVVPRIIVHAQESIPANVTFVADAARGRLSYLGAVMRVITQHRFDLVICGHVNLLPLARLTRQRPLLITHGIEAWKPLRDPFSNKLIHEVRGLVSVSALTRDRFVSWSHFRGRTFVLPNAVHAADYGVRPKSAALIERFGIAGKRVILTLGRIVAAERYKGFDEVLDVLPSLAPDVVYVIAGRGSDVDRLARKAVRLGVSDRVVFTGFIDESEKADLYNLADVYAMPSRGEGFGFVFLEAMACGVPVIGSKHDGGREALRSGTLGTLVDPANLADIRSALEEALEVTERRVPDGLAYFSYENFETRVAEIVTSVVASPPQQH
jgi:glycosyltransferase involved in cell wall biosynthesis